MRKTLLLLLAVALCAAAMSACSGGSLDDTAGTGTEANTYRGETLTCIEDGIANQRVRTCDFDAFYALHPDLLNASDHS